MAKIASPLFIVREDCRRDLFAVLDKLAEIGFDGIELLGFFGQKPAALKQQLDGCGLTALGNHVPFAELSGSTEKVLDDHRQLGCEYLTVGAPDSGGMPGGTDYPRTLDTLAGLAEAAKKAGITLLFHNHAAELKDSVDGKTLLSCLLDDSPLRFEPDLGWMAIAGADPAYYLRQYKNRCPVVHFKDYMPGGPEGFTFRPTGYGVINNAALYALCLEADTPPAWYVMDHDCAYHRNPYDDLRLSLEYFKNLMMVHEGAGV